MSIARPQYYILVDHKPVRASAQEWARWFETADRKVANDHVGEAHISTVFLGMGFDNGLFETMIFGGPHDQYQTRCSTWEEALNQHQTAIYTVLQNSGSASHEPQQQEKPE